MLYSNDMFQDRKPRRCRIPNAPPKISHQDAVTVARGLGCLDLPGPSTAAPDIEDQEDHGNDWVEEENSAPDQIVTANPAFETAAQTFARLSRGARFAEKRQRFLHQWSVLPLTFNTTSGLNV